MTKNQNVKKEQTVKLGEHLVAEIKGDWIIVRDLHDNIVVQLSSTDTWNGVYVLNVNQKYFHEWGQETLKFRVEHDHYKPMFIAEFLAVKPQAQRRD